MLSKHHLGWIIFIELHIRRQLYLRYDGWNALWCWFVVYLNLSIRMQCSRKLTCWWLHMNVIAICRRYDDITVILLYCTQRLFTRPILRLLLRNLGSDRTQIVNLILILIKHIILLELFILTIFVRNIISSTIWLTFGRYVVLKLSRQILVFCNDLII